MLGIAWYYTDVLNDGAFKVKRELPERDLVVRSVAEGAITLAPSGDAADAWQQDGVFGLEWEGGYAQVGKILDLHKDRVVRELRSGTPPRPGTRVRLDSFAYRPDPGAIGLTFSEVPIATPLGEAPAWRLAGTRDTWAIFVHGHRSSRPEALRLLPVLVARGHPSLVITYRNDPEAPLSPDKRHNFGATEWEDLAAAMEYARSQGARRFVLIGYSMGGGIVMALMERPQLAQQVVGLILDAPLADLGETIDFRAERRGLPQPFTDVAKRLAALRFDVDFGRLDYVKRSKELKTPVLLFHGDADTTAAISVSDAFARERPDIVSYVRVAGAGHVRSWNADPAAYEAAVRAFLQRVAP